MQDQKIRTYNLKNSKGTEVVISNYGTIILSFRVKMKDGKHNDIVLGFETIEEYRDENYLKTYPYFGAAIGRYANRIANGSFKIDGKEFLLSKNHGNCQLHGGFHGFDKKIWNEILFDEKNNQLELQCLSADGEEGFPGSLETTICFELTDGNELKYTYTAVTNLPTVINLTHHSYFNLNNGGGTIADHELKIYADKILEQDHELVPTGNYLPVNDTKFDFREFTRLDKNWGNDGYDQSFVVENSENKLIKLAEARSKKSGLCLEVYSAEPIVHLYTGQGIPKLKGKNGIVYGPYSGFCLETQKHPNAINIPSFPNTILRPGQKYFQETMYKIVGTVV
jgi:aldose 1-epimerase